MILGIQSGFSPYSFSPPRNTAGANFGSGFGGGGATAPALTTVPPQNGVAGQQGPQPAGANPTQGVQGNGVVSPAEMARRGFTQQLTVFDYTYYGKLGMDEGEFIDPNSNLTVAQITEIGVKAHELAHQNTGRDYGVVAGPINMEQDGNGITVAGSVQLSAAAPDINNLNNYSVEQLRQFQTLQLGMWVAAEAPQNVIEQYLEQPIPEAAVAGFAELSDADIRIATNARSNYEAITRAITRKEGGDLNALEFGERPPHQLAPRPAGNNSPAGGGGGNFGSSPLNGTANVSAKGLAMAYNPNFIEVGNGVF